MSEVDLINGYVRIANKLLEIIYSSNFNATQLKILLMIMRYTYGFNRKSHSLSITFLAKGTGVSRRYITKELNKLISGKVIHIVSDHTATESREISINKNYKSWLGYGTIVPQVNNSSTGEPEFNTGGEQSFHSPGDQLFTQDKTNIKTNIKTSTYTDIFESFYKLYPHPKGKAQTFKNWKKVIKQHEPDLILESAKRYKKTVEGTEKEFITTSYNFLGNKEVYLDYLPGTSETDKPRKEPGKVKEMSQEELEELFEEKRKAEWRG